MDASDLHAWWTVALLVLFVGIFAWAWSARRSEDFEAARRLPLEEDANSEDLCQ